MLDKFFRNSQETMQRIQKKDPEIAQFVEENKEAIASELKELEGLGFGGKIYYIGMEKGYHKRRNQYGTTSHPITLISPRFIFYPTITDKDPTPAIQDIQKLLAYAQEKGRKVAIRCGGHQYCAYSSTEPTNIQIDVSKCFPQYEYDAKENVLTSGPSHALGDWAVMNHKNGIYFPMGVCANVHLGGHVHTGGWGMVARSHGLLADHVLSFDIILADGTFKTVNRPADGTDQANDDLYFAVLGGGRGGDFGVLTQLRLQPLKDKEGQAVYAYMWLKTREKTEAVVQVFQEYQAKCVTGEIPSDYEFMLTITGLGIMETIPNISKEPLKRALEKVGAAITGNELVAPPLIQLWMCYTNKSGDKFNPQWFEAFKERVGEPLPFVGHENTSGEESTISWGIANVFIFHIDREMEYPFVKRARVTMNMPPEGPKSYAKRVQEISGNWGTEHGLHLVSQMQLYTNGAVAEFGKLGITSYSWRNLSMAWSHDAFYHVRSETDNARDEAEKWQAENDEVFIGESGTYSPQDMRLFAYTFGTNRNLTSQWQYFYDSEGKWDRLRQIKTNVDPNGLFNCNPFCLPGIDVKTAEAPCGDDEKQQ